MQNKDYYLISTKGLRLSAHSMTKIQNAPISLTSEKLKSCWQHYQIQVFCPVFSSKSYLVFHPFPEMKDKIRYKWMFMDLIFKELDGIGLCWK